MNIALSVRGPDSSSIFYNWSNNVKQHLNFRSCWHYTKFLRKKASAELALPTIVAICGDHDKLWYIVRLRYFIESTLYRV